MPESASTSRVVLTTAGSQEQAVSIGRGLVERRLAACVNLVERCCSIYRWKGEIVAEGEVLLLIKTEQSQLDELERALRELHSYDVPELLVLDVAGGSADYLQWLGDNVGAAKQS